MNLMRGRGLPKATALARVAALAATVLAGGCNTTIQEQLGLDKRAPDEFQVVQRAPLIIPPDSSLRPPAPGAAPIHQQDVTAEARDLLTGQKDGTTTPATVADAPLSGGERSLLAASPVQATGGIREQVTAENIELAQLDRRTFLVILNFQKRQFEPKDQVLNAQQEAARLRGEAVPGAVVTVRTASTPITTF